MLCLLIIMTTFIHKFLCTKILHFNFQISKPHTQVSSPYTFFLYFLPLVQYYRKANYVNINNCNKIIKIIIIKQVNL